MKAHLTFICIMTFYINPLSAEASPAWSCHLVFSTLWQFADNVTVSGANYSEFLSNFLGWGVALMEMVLLLVLLLFAVYL